MFYTLMQQYLWQQLQQIQTFQYQQSQYMDWQYRQLQAWQQAMLNSPFFKQLLWLPYTEVWTAGFAPLSWPFMQYSMHISRQPVHTQSCSAVTTSVNPLRDVATTPSQSTNHKTLSITSTATSATSATTVDTQMPTMQPSSESSTAEADNALNKPPTKHTSAVTPSTQSTDDVASKLIVPAELLTVPPQQAETAPPQADIPQPKEVAHLSQPNTAADPHKHNDVIQDEVHKAEKVLRQIQRKETDLPAPAQLAKVDTAMVTPTAANHLPTMEPISAIEQVRQPVDAIDLNQATEAQLLRLDGINRRMAKDIINYRDKNTAFTHIDELTNIKGIGQFTLNKIRHCLIIPNSSEDVTAIHTADQMTKTIEQSTPFIATVPKK